MTNFIKTAAVAGTMFAAVAGATAANAAPVTANAQAKARIVKQLTVAKKADLDFGAIVVGATGGNVSVGTDNVRSCDTALTCTGSSARGWFEIQGSRNENVTISSDASVSLVNAADATKTMTATLARSANALQLDNGGVGNLYVGGTLAVGANQVEGSYAGTFNVSVDYQ